MYINFYIDIIQVSESYNATINTKMLVMQFVCTLPLGSCITEYNTTTTQLLTSVLFFARPNLFISHSRTFDNRIFCY